MDMEQERNEATNIPAGDDSGRQFVTGFLTGFGICAAVGVIFLLPRVLSKLGQRHEKAFHGSRTDFTNEGEGYGEIPGVIHDSSTAIKDAVDSLGRTFHEGREIIDSTAGP